MKYFKLLAIMAGLLMCACSLEEENPSAITTDSDWKTAAGYQKLINACYYDFIRITYGQAEDTFVVNAEGGTDIWQDSRDGSNGNWSRLLLYSGDFSGLLGEAYTSFYATLNICNAAIEYATKVQGLSEAQVNALVAEAYYLRAHSLYHIVEQYGGKYLATTPTTEAKKTLECSKVNDFYAVILSDLEFAMKHLPVSHAEYGHVKRAAAYSLYAKACLTYAAYTDGKGHADAITTAEAQELYSKAQVAADFLIDNAASMGVRLYDDVAEVFDENNNKSNEEALFVVCHSMTQALNPRGNYYNRVWKHFSAYNANNAGVYLDGLQASYETSVNGVAVPRLAKGNDYLQPSKYLIDLYEEGDKRYDAFFQDKYYINKANTADGKGYQWTEIDAKRYGLSTNRVGNPEYNIGLGELAVYISRETYTQEERDAVPYAIYNIEDNYKDPANPGKFYPSLSKFDTPSLYAGSNASKPYSGADCIILRLGETYLLSAEAHWRLGNNAKAADRINVLRQRAGAAKIAAADIDQDFLLDEHAREMCGEWMRWFTLKRFRAFESRLQKCNPQITEFDASKHYVRPVPTWVLANFENGDEYQNPGY
ncbi:MAG: RagB/SusD family nutrient uptake outer membrane protein [Alistipes sp.]|nr:RagB/SusD family nutrient uptake outer membrane protein [Alistipes sp.]